MAQHGGTLAPATPTRPHATPHPTPHPTGSDAGPRVRHQVRDALGLMAFSAGVSVALAVALTALAVVLG